MGKICWLFVEVKFYTPDLQNLCEDSKLMQRKFGPPLAKKLRARLDDLHGVQEAVGSNPITQISFSIQS